MFDRVMDYEVGHGKGKGFQGKRQKEEKVERLNTELHWANEGEKKLER